MGERSSIPSGRRAPRSGAPSATEPVVRIRSELFGARLRTTTGGVVLLVLMVAFEAMGVSTAMPALVAELGALSHYAWPFVTFMAAAVFGTVVGGWWCDRGGPRMPLLIAPILFGVGLLTAGSASAMPQLLVGRILQGLGAGSVTVAMYVLIALLYPERVRPAMFGLMSSAWVLPALVGPPIAGALTERFSWRWVFFGLVPMVILAFVLVVPAVRRLGSPASGEDKPEKRRGVVAAAFGAAAGVSGLSFAAERPDLTAAAVAVVALLVLVPSLWRLLPAGVFRGRRGVPTVVAARGLAAALFFTTASYLPLMLTSTHRWSLVAAGVPLVVGSLGWSMASMWQGRHPGLPRPRLLRVGFILLVVGAAGLLLVVPSWGVPWLAVPVWAVAGIGMGLCFPSIAFLLMRQSDPAELGFHTSAAQMADQLGTAAMVGAGGALLALFGAPSTALSVLLVVLAALGVLGATLASRTVLAG